LASLRFDNILAVTNFAAAIDFAVKR